MKCDNCPATAEFKNEGVGFSTQYFCKACVPWTLKDKLRNKTLALAYTAPAAVEVEEVAAPKPKRKQVVSEETLEDVEVPAEPEVVEELPIEEVQS